MTTYIYDYAAWIALPPAPLNHATVRGILCLDGKNTFCYDGTNCAIFNYESLSWSYPYPCPALSSAAQVSQVNAAGYYQIIDSTNSTVYLMSVADGYLTNLPYLGGLIFSSAFTAYLNRGWAWPPPVGLYDEILYYIAEFPNFIFYLYTENGGPVSTITIAVDLVTGKPCFQFAGGGTGYGGYVNSGYMIIPAMAGTTNANNTAGVSPHIFGYWYNSDIANMMLNMFLVNYTVSSLPLAAFIDALPYTFDGGLGYITTPNNSAYACPAFQFVSNPPLYLYEGFIGANQALVYDAVYASGNNGALTPDYVYTIQPNGNLLLTPTTYYTGGATGYYGLPINIAPPSPIAAPGLGSDLLPVSNIRAGNVFGYFAPDFSSGYFLGIAQAGYSAYTLNNYKRN